MQKKIYLAGGCFWGVQAYFDRLHGVISTIVGYANSLVTNPSYEQVCSGTTGASEAIEVVFETDMIALSMPNVSEITAISQVSDCILARFFSIIEPFSLNRQGNDVGEQYRSGIYSIDSNDLKAVGEFVDMLNRLANRRVATEVLPLQNFYKAETYHQKYLQKNPNGYCHIRPNDANLPLDFRI